MRSLVEELEARRATARLGGGEERIARQHAQDKLTARERLDLLIDAGTWVELGIHGRPHFSQRAMEGKEAPADGVVTGYGKVDGRLVAVAAYDFTVMAGSMGMTGETKVARLRELALSKRIPLIWLLDSAGARIQEAAGSLFAGSGHLFREEVVMSGVVPQVAALMGPCAAGTAYIPGLADFVPMVKGRGSMALAGPHLTKAVTGEDVTQEELGGSKVHTRVSGVGDLEVDSDEDCIRAIRDYLSYFPSHCEEAPPRREAADPVDRRDEELLDILPESPRKPYDMYDVIGHIVDDGEWFDLKPRFARTIITCLARMGGRPVGIVANQPRHLGGILENDSADKAARFINLCDAYGIPLLFLQDVPGFMVGTKVERAGIIRHGAKMLYAVSRATVPKVTVVVRKAYGAGYYVMCGRAYEPDLIVAWPSAEISVMGPEGAVNIIFRKQIEAAEDPDATRAEMIEGIRRTIDPYIAAGNAMVDDIIDPRETRPVVCPGPRDGGDEAGRAALEEAWGDAGLRRRSWTALVVRSSAWRSRCRRRFCSGAVRRRGVAAVPLGGASTRRTPSRSASAARTTGRSVGSQPSGFRAVNWDGVRRLASSANGAAAGRSSTSGLAPAALVCRAARGARQLERVGATCRDFGDLNGSYAALFHRFERRSSCSATRQYQHHRRTLRGSRPGAPAGQCPASGPSSPITRSRTSIARLRRRRNPASSSCCQRNAGDSGSSARSRAGERVARVRSPPHVSLGTSDSATGDPVVRTTVYAEPQAGTVPTLSVTSSAAPPTSDARSA